MVKRKNYHFKVDLTLFKKKPPYPHKDVQHAEAIYHKSSLFGTFVLKQFISKRNDSATVATIKKLCDGLGITISEFFDTEYFNNLEQEIK